jgi:hypothetical protein
MFVAFVPLLAVTRFSRTVGTEKRCIQFFYLLGMVGFDLLFIAKRDQLFDSRGTAIFSMLVVTGVMSWRISANRRKRGDEEDADRVSLMLQERQIDMEASRPPGKGPIYIGIISESHFIPGGDESRAARWLSTSIFQARMS